MEHFEVQCRLATYRALASEERAKVLEEHAQVESDQARTGSGQRKLGPPLRRAKPHRWSAKDSKAFETGAAAVANRAYNLGFGDCKKVADAFSSFDLCQITPTGKPEEEPVQVADGDDASEEVIKVPMPEAAGVSLATMLQDTIAVARGFDFLP